MKYLNFVGILFLCSLWGYSQKMVITGRVIDADGFPLFQATVVKIGTSEGVLTAMDGTYRIEAEPSDRLEFRFVGFQTQRVLVGERIVIDVQLRPLNQLDEIVVIGYGATTKRNLVDNVASVQSRDFAEIPSIGVQTQLIGRVPGVQIVQNNGLAESGIKIRVRGVSAIGGDTEPLYVLDGVPINATVTSGETNPLLNINPNDIQSIEILKDASSAAIYGSRGTNGVVLITTKQGKVGATRVVARTSMGISTSNTRRDLMNTEEYVAFMQEAGRNSGFSEDFMTGLFNRFALEESDWRNARINTDWQDLALVTGYVQDHGFSVSGGSNATQYFISAGYNKNDAIVRDNGSERYTMRFNLDHTVGKWLQIGTRSNLARTQIKKVPQGSNDGAPLTMVWQVPFTRPFNVDGSPTDYGLYYNPLIQSANAEWDQRIWNVQFNTYAEFRIDSKLKFRTSLGYTLSPSRSERFFGSRTAQGRFTNGLGVNTSTSNERFLINGILTYRKDWGALKGEALVGASYENVFGEILEAEGIDFPNDQLRTLRSAGEVTDVFASNGLSRLISYFTRMNLTYKNRYIFKGSIRADGSSRFGRNNQFGYFPALSAGWILSHEPFWQGVDPLNLVKFRVSWGLTGNQEIGNNGNRTILSSDSYLQDPTLRIFSFGDQNLRWEETEQFNFGLDLGLWNDRIRLSTDFYIKDTQGILNEFPIPDTSGLSSAISNIGGVRNTGWELDFQSQNIITKDFAWSTNFNLSFNKNRVTELPNGEDIILFSTLTRVGQPIGLGFAQEYAGVDPSNGDALWYRNSTNPDGSLDRSTTNDYNEAERIAFGQIFPSYLAGLTNTIMFKGLDLSFTFNGQWGVTKVDANAQFDSGNGTYLDNQARSQLRRWQNPGDVTDVPQARLFQENGSQWSTRYYYNADFVRLRDLTLGYTFPSDVMDRLSLTSARIFLSGTNLLTFTDFPGWDPETASNSSADTAIFSGFVANTPPLARTISIGLNIEF